jgi:hypothetical protein
MRWSEAGYLSQIVLMHALRQVSVSLILDVRQKKMKTHAQDASRLKVLHQLGIVSGQQVIAWADHVIAESAKPDSTLIDLSLTAPDSAYDIDQILGILSAERTFGRRWMAFCRRFARDASRTGSLLR